MNQVLCIQVSFAYMQIIFWSIIRSQVRLIWYRNQTLSSLTRWCRIIMVNRVIFSYWRALAWTILYSLQLLFQLHNLDIFISNLDIFISNQFFHAFSSILGLLLWQHKVKTSTMKILLPFNGNNIARTFTMKYYKNIYIYIYLGIRVLY